MKPEFDRSVCRITKEVSKTIDVHLEHDGDFRRRSMTRAQIVASGSRLIPAVEATRSDCEAATTTPMRSPAAASRGLPRGDESRSCQFMICWTVWTPVICAHILD